MNKKEKDRLEGKLISKCCDLVDSSIRIAAHLLDAAKLEFEALMTVMILVNAQFLASAVRLYDKVDRKKFMDTFLDEVRIKTGEMIKECQTDKNVN